jgi:hypothetical protein
MEFMGYIRPNIIAKKRRILFFIKQIYYETTPQLKECILYNIINKTGYLKSILDIAEEFDVLEEFNNLISAWQLNQIPQFEDREKIKQTQIVKHIEENISRNEKKYWFENTHHIDFNMINIPGKGSKLMRLCQNPDGWSLFHLRYDFILHFQRHSNLNYLAHNCNCCNQKVAETNKHILEECNGSKLSREDSKKFMHNISKVLSFHSQYKKLYQNDNIMDYIYWLTGPLNDEITFPLDEIDEICSAAKEIYLMRLKYAKISEEKNNKPITNNNNNNNINNNNKVNAKDKKEQIQKLIKTINQCRTLIDYNDITQNSQFTETTFRGWKSVTPKDCIPPLQMKSLLTDLDLLLPLILCPNSTARFEYLNKKEYWITKKSPPRTKAKLIIQQITNLKNTIENFTKTGKTDLKWLTELKFDPIIFEVEYFTSPTLTTKQILPLAEDSKNLLVKTNQFIASHKIRLQRETTKNKQNNIEQK